MRSKSEKIIADKLYSMGIPYRYEYPLVLERDIVVYPDFTILKIGEQKTLYLEHLGINLFVTYETATKPLNTRVLNDFLRKLFC